MIVSLLQLMGFPLGKTVHSRAGEMPSNGHEKVQKKAQTGSENVQNNPARRDKVKATATKDNKAKSAPSKAKVAAKPIAKKDAVKSSAKLASKPAIKPSAKSTAKPAAKAVVSKVTPAKAKPAVKVAAKPVAKPKVVAKAAAKPAKSKAVPAKAAPKAVAKPVAKPAPKSVAKPAAKPAVSPAKSSAMPKAAKASAPVSTKAPVIAKPLASQTPAPKAVPEPTKAKVEVVKPVAVATPVAPAVPQKSGRPSSRLAQLTVPSMAQTVASTAAKSSFSPSIPTTLIVPALPSSVKKDPKLANNWKTKPVAELTDAELMAMPDSEYMNDVQMAAFRLKLTRLKQDILNSAGETTEHLREDTSVVPDPADRATIEEEHALELRTRDRERKLLKKIEQSIVRIDAGDYGYCDETGEPIGVGRLLARPTATLSLEAQQRRELKQKMFGD